MLCKLCQKEKAIENSHIIPKFFFDWLKATSVTGKIRVSVNPQKREQDGPKVPLLCKNCEKNFSIWEKYFAENIFKPYVNNILDDIGNLKNDENLSYDENLLKFVISVQFRILLTRNTKESLSPKHENKIKETIEQWREYLLSNTKLTGDNRSYIFFLTSIFALSIDESYDPSRLNWFIHRTFFKDIIFKNSRLGILTKLGPIIIYTSLIPDKAKGMGIQMIHKKGIIDIKNSSDIPDRGIDSYIYQTKYKVSTDIKYSEKQESIIAQDWLNKGSNAQARKIFEQDLRIYMTQKEINKFEDD
jgi:hypothetical protein